MANYKDNKLVGAVYFGSERIKVLLAEKVLTPTESFKFTVNSGNDSSFMLPLSGNMHRTYATDYDLLVDWGDESEPEVVQGTSSKGHGVSHTYANANQNYQITISPNGDTDGWGVAFGFGYQTKNEGCNVQTNKDKMISLDSSLTKSMIMKSGNLDNVGAYMFNGCSNLTMGSEFNLPQDITEVGNGFCDSIFYNCSNLTMNEIFNIPQGITSVGGSFLLYIFDGCSNLTMNDIFQLPQGITSIGEKFVGGMFNGCSKLTMNDVFNLPQGIIGATEGYFCYQMFNGCSNLTMNEIFNIPQGITSVGDNCFGHMFNGCSKLTMNEVFNLPQNISGKVGSGFGFQMFYNCLKIAMNSVFNLPQNITEVGSSFCYRLFGSSDLLTMNSVFNLPQNISGSVGNNFCNDMFSSCSNLTMNDIFQLPQNITSVGNNFCNNMFSSCSNLTMNDIFQLPQNITSVDSSFCSDMFYKCIMITTGIKHFFGNLVLSQEQLNIKYVLYRTFRNCTGITEEISASTIPQLAISPTNNNLCFSSANAEAIRYCPVNWGGTGEVKPEPESFKFTVNSGEDSSFMLPLSGNVVRKYATDYNLLVDWGDESEPEAISGTSTDGHGVSHTYANANQNYQITISPNGDTDGWGVAFGFAYGNKGCNVQTNKDKMISLDSPLTKSMVCKTGELDGICNRMFQDCTNLTMGSEFNLPQDITEVGNGFCSTMFMNCSKLTMNDVFQLPQGITTIGDSFCGNMFQNCSNITMNDTFQLPQGITSAVNFCGAMFQNCSKLTMNDVFNLPQNITEVGFAFCTSMFYGCSNLTMNDVFQLPQGITSAHFVFCSSMFQNCISLTNGIQHFFGNLVLSQGELNKSGVFDSTFATCIGITEEISADTIPQLAISPTATNACFKSANSTAIANCPANWK